MQYYFFLYESGFINIFDKKKENFILNHFIKTFTVRSFKINIIKRKYTIQKE